MDITGGLIFYKQFENNLQTWTDYIIIDTMCSLFFLREE